MRGKWKKLAAPVIVTVLLLGYYFGLALLFSALAAIPRWLRIALAAVPLGLCGAAVYVLVRRIREIRRGEDDDLDQY